MKLSLDFIWIFILFSTALSRSHRSLNKHNHGRYLSINSPLKHHKTNSLTRRKRSELYSTGNLLKKFRTTTMREDIINTTSPQIMQSTKIETQPLAELANIFGSTEKVLNLTNLNDLLDDESFQSHVRVKRDNPDFNEVIKPLPDEAIEVHPKNFFNPKSYVGDDYSLLKNNFDDVYPESSGLIDYDKSLISAVKSKREIKKEYIPATKKNPETNNLHKKRRQSPNESLNVGNENDIMKQKSNDKLKQSRSIVEAKELAQQLIAKVNEIENLMDGSWMNQTKVIEQSPISRRAVNGAARNVGVKRMRKAKRHRQRRKHRGNRRKKRKSHRKWERWSDWSSCSVTCGKGRQIRWRHCIRDCTTAETEMEEKICQLPACAPGKFLGIF